MRAGRLIVSVLLMVAIGIVAQLRAQVLDESRIAIDYGLFSVVYDVHLKVPVEAYWLLRAQDIGTTTREPSWRFREDTHVPSPRATHADYNRSGYDRGHMCPAADRSTSRQTMRATFVMTNVCPQAPALNRGAWKRLENGCRSYALGGHPIAIHVDAVWWKADTQLIGKNHVAVPHGFVKTIRDPETDSIIYAKYFQNL